MLKSKRSPSSKRHVTSSFLYPLTGMVLTAIVFFQLGTLLSFHGSSTTSTDSDDDRNMLNWVLARSRTSKAEIKKEIKPPANELLVKDPPFWMEETQDDFYERIYVDPTPLTHLRQNISVKYYFPAVCGLFRFNHTLLPQASIIMTLRNEIDELVTLTAHTILARTPPELLLEIIIVDDSDIKNSTELQRLQRVSEKIIIIPTTEREGCARSRLIGARRAIGDILVFIDSHVEMLSSTWYQHLVLPIVENPRTVTSQHLHIMGEYKNHTYGNPGGSHYGTMSNMLYFAYESFRHAGQPYKSVPSSFEPFEMPMGPGALFAIRQDEFWRLGGYDKGLYVWGGENIELSLKLWMCGSRLVHVPCSQVGHMYRKLKESSLKWNLENHVELAAKLGLNETADYKTNGQPQTNLMMRIWLRNNIRVASVWLGEEWKKYYYKTAVGSMELPPEWKKCEEDDEDLLEQKRIKEANQCKDFDWYDRHVFMRLLGTHNPWYKLRYQNLTDIPKISLAPHVVKPKKKKRPGMVYCNDSYHKGCQKCALETKRCDGDCKWNSIVNMCQKTDFEEEVVCGGHRANSCGECPQGNGAAWCNGQCQWHYETNTCIRKPLNVHDEYLTLINKYYSFQPVTDERGNYVNIILVRAPFRSQIEIDLYHKLKNEILFLGISSFENYPLNSPNPFSQNFSDTEYVGLFPGFLHMMRNPRPVFPESVKLLFASESDFALNVALHYKYGERKTMKKEYDFVYVGTDQNVDTDCIGWGAFAKNWSFAYQALEVMCSDEFNLTGVLAATKNKQGTKACSIPDSCKGKMVQTSFMPQADLFDYVLKSKFVFLPQVYDASPRASSQALALNIPILMNQNIIGGWKYVNNQTGEFFHDMSNFKQSLRRLRENIDKHTYEPREYVINNLGNQRYGKLFFEFVMENFADRVKLPASTKLLLPAGA